MKIILRTIGKSIGGSFIKIGQFIVDYFEFLFIFSVTGICVGIFSGIVFGFSGIDLPFLPRGLIYRESANEFLLTFIKWFFSGLVLGFIIVLLFIGLREIIEQTTMLSGNSVDHASFYLSLLLISIFSFLLSYFLSTDVPNLKLYKFYFSISAAVFMAIKSVVIYLLAYCSSTEPSY